MHLIASFIAISTLMGCSEKENIRSANSGQNSSAEPTTTLAAAEGTTTFAPADPKGTIAPTELTTMVATFAPADAPGTIAPTELTTMVATFAPAYARGTIAPTEQTPTVATFGMGGGRASVAVSLGAPFWIQMATNLSTGHNWHLEGTLPACLVKTRDFYPSSTTGRRLPGAAGTRTLEYITTEQCAAPLRFRYKRGREADSESDAMITVDISVQFARDST